MKITLQITGQSSALDKVAKLASTETRAAGNRIAGQALRDYVANWYREKGEKHWLNPKLPTHGPGRKKTGWGTTLNMGWQVLDATAEAVSVGTPDENGVLRHKINGGTISAKNARALTIPIIPKAHGKRVVDYVRETGKQLFTLRQSLLNIRNQYKGTDHQTGYLFEKFGRDGIRAVYALKKSIRQAPWPNAIPKSEDMQGVFKEALTDYFITETQE